MSVILTLEDGRQLHGSTLGMAGMFKLISDVMSPDVGRLKVWLADLNNRCAPFLDFDIRGIPASDRDLIYASAEIAFEELKSKFGEGVEQKENHFSARCLFRFLEMKESIRKGEPPEALSDSETIYQFDGEEVEYDDLWGRSSDSA